MATRERIVSEALKLFSRKGYSDVYLSEIASAVGIKTPSLYKHFENKQAIFDECVNTFYKRMEINRCRFETDTDFKDIDKESLVKKIGAMFEFYLEDEVASAFRRMLQIERYGNEELNSIFEKIFVTDAINYEEEIFSELIKQGFIIDVNSHVLALSFYGTVFFLLQKYDMCPERKRDALKELRLFVEEFCRVYGVRK